MPATPWSSTRAALAVYLTALATFAVTLHGGFVYDDIWTILENSFIRRLGNLVELISPETLRNIPDGNRPLMVASTILDFQLWRLEPAGYHVVNVVLHGLCSIGVFALVRRVFDDARLALAAGLMFAVHPMHAEPVAMVSYREDLLATVLTLAALLATLGARPPRHHARLVGAAACAALAVLAKESALVTAPLLVVCWWGTGTAPPRRRRVLACALLLVPAALLYAALYVALGDANATIAREVPSLGHRLWTEAPVLVAGIAQLVVPVGLSAEYEVVPPGLAAGAGSLAVLATSAVAALRLRRRVPAVALGLAWLLVALLPTAGFVPLHNPRADRYLYLPSVGFCIAAGHVLLVAGDHLARRLGRAGSTAWLPLGPLVVCCALLAGATQLRAAVWSDPLALWSEAVERAPRSPRAWSGLAIAAIDAGQLDRAAFAVERGLAIAPEHGLLLMAGAIASAERGDLEAAVRGFERARTRIGRGQRHRVDHNLGIALRDTGQLDEAAAALRRAVAGAPANASYRRALAAVLARLGRTLEAIVEYRRALSLDPGDAVARRALRELERQ